MASEKRFHLNASQIVELVPGRGGCFATDMIVVEGCPVRYMYREEPDFDIDSGWRFMAGYESVDYMDEPSNIGIYDVNTIANYDRSVIPFLDAPVGSAFEKRSGAEEFIDVDPPVLD